MKGFNRGEWSELYVALYLLEHPNLQIADSNLNVIQKDIFVFKDIIRPASSNIRYYAVALNEAESVPQTEKPASQEILISGAREKVYYKIISAPTGGGSFSFSGLSSSDHKGKLKAKSKIKADLIANVDDLIIKQSIEVGYSIKSMMGSPSTLLNASSATNFEYVVHGLNKKEIQRINSIRTRTKLKDRLQKIIDLGGIIKFQGMTNETFEKNLQMIDTQMPQIIGNVLLESYKSGNKNLLYLFANSPLIKTESIAYKKLSDLLEAISFGMFPTKIWDGCLEVNGGILISKKDGNVVLLDSIYHKKEVQKFLVEQTRLDSPSTSRYHMLELREDDTKKGTYCFTLNLQIRYKH